MKGLFFKDFENTYLPLIFEEIYIDAVYAPYLEDKNFNVVLDIGANIGLFTWYAHTHTKKIYAIEPAREHFEVLDYMVKFNKMDNVIPKNQAIGLKDGTQDLYHCSNTTMHSLISGVKTIDDKKDKVNEKEIVDVVTIDTFLKQNNIKEVDFMKLDIEGLECELIGGSAFEKAAPKIKTIVGEWHGWSMINPDQMATALMDYGFDFRWISTKGMKHQSKLFVAMRK